MAEEDKDESPEVNTDETDEEAWDTCLAFDDDLDSEVVDFTIEEDDRIFMTMVHLVDPHHFVRTSSMVSGRLVEEFAKKSKPKGFEDVVLMSLHIYADIFSETAPSQSTANGTMPLSWSVSTHPDSTKYIR
jgi:hypothetical protein